jgi:hypothetical protein
MCSPLPEVHAATNARVVLTAVDGWLTVVAAVTDAVVLLVNTLLLRLRNCEGEEEN